MRPEPAAKKRIRRLFGLMPKFNQPTTRIGFSHKTLAKPLPAANPELFVLAQDYGSQILGLNKFDQNFSNTVAKLIVGALQRGEASEARLSPNLA